MPSATTPASSKRFIGLAAPARSGKDTVANMLLEHDNVAAYALADPLKAACQVLFGLTDEEAWGDEFKEISIQLWERSPRQFFQRVGTEWMREYRPDHWLMRAERELNDAPGIVDVPASWRGRPQAVYRLGAQAVFGLSLEQTWHLQHGDILDHYWDMTPEAMFQLVERYALRDYPDFVSRRKQRPVSAATREPGIRAETDLVILKDVRFENEAKYIRDRGGLIWHIRRESQRLDDHASELGIAFANGDIELDNNGTLDALRAQVQRAWRCALSR